MALSPKEDIMKNLHSFVYNFNRAHEEHPTLDGELIAHLRGVIEFCDRKATNSYYDIFGLVAKNLRWVLSLPYGSDLSRFSSLLRKKFGNYNVIERSLGSLGYAVVDAIFCAKDDVLGTEEDPEIVKFVEDQVNLIFNKIEL